MNQRELLDLICMAAMLAVALHWVFSLEVELHWTLCVCLVSILIAPWLTDHLGPLTSSRPKSDLLVAAAFATTALLLADNISFRSSPKRRRPSEDRD